MYVIQNKKPKNTMIKKNISCGSLSEKFEIDKPIIKVIISVMINDIPMIIKHGNAAPLVRALLLGYLGWEG